MGIQMVGKNKKEELPVLKRVITCEYPDPFHLDRVSWYSSNVYEIQDYDCLGDLEENKDDKN